MSVLCIDIGNTHTHLGRVTRTTDGEWLVRAHATVATPLLADPADGVALHVVAWLREETAGDGIAFCSVVPAATPLLRAVLAQAAPTAPVFHLTHASDLGVPISYPRPAEIGQDRLANAAAARVLAGRPAVVVDSGTAVTFDIVTTRGGYEGGIIAPGLELTRRYLHERTAQLPLLDEALEIEGVIGKSTTEAMRIGSVIGFPGMIQALLDAVLQELALRGEPFPHLFITGGSAGFLQKKLRPALKHVPDLTLIGLAAVRHLNR